MERNNKRKVVHIAILIQLYFFWFKGWHRLTMRMHRIACVHTIWAHY